MSASTLSTLELFAVFAAQLPLLSREDLEDNVRMMRGAPGWGRALEHAREQAAILGLDAIVDDAEARLSQNRH